jgi:hypothetical protein
VIIDLRRGRRLLSYGMRNPSAYNDKKGERAAFITPLMKMTRLQHFSLRILKGKGRQQ